MNRILIIEDNIEINQMILEKLNKEGFECEQAFSGTEARLLMSLKSFDLILLDLMLPGLSGEDFLVELREKDTVPIIVVSAKESVETKVKLLLQGADDYIVKPFDLNELVARIEVQLRKRKGESAHDVVEHRGFVLDYENGTFSFGDQEIAFTRREYRILETIILNPKKVFTKQNIYEAAWDEHYIGDDTTLNVHISNIRKKLRKFTEEELIETVWGVGFRLKRS